MKIWMISLDIDPHLICVSCRGGRPCNLDERCVTCVDWSDERMNAYVKHVQTLERKRNAKRKLRDQMNSQVDDFALLCTGGSGAGSSTDNLVGSREGEIEDESSVNSASHAHIKDVVTAQLNIFSSGLDEKFDRLAASLRQAVNSGNNSYNNNNNNVIPDVDNYPVFDYNTSVSAPPSASVLKPRSRVLDPSPSNPPTGRKCLEDERVEPMQLGHNIFPDVSPQTTRTLKTLDALRSSGVLSPEAYVQCVANLSQAPVASSVASVQAIPDQAMPAFVPDQVSPAFVPDQATSTGPIPHRSSFHGGAGPAGDGQSGELDDEIVDEDADNESCVGASVTDFRKLYNLVTTLFPSAKSTVAPEPPRRFIHEESVDGVAPQATSSSKFSFYKRLSQVREEVANKNINLAESSNKASKILPKKRTFYRMADEVNYVTPQKLNSDFGRITSTPVNSSASVLVPLDELKKLELAAINLQEAQSFASWMVSTIFGYARESGFEPPDPSLYSKISSSVSLSLVEQSKIAHAMSACLSTLRRQHFLKHCAPTVTESQKSRLAASSPFSKFLFDPDVLTKVAEEFEGTAATQHHLGVSKALASGALFFANKKSGALAAPASSYVNPGTSTAQAPDQSGVDFSTPSR